MKSREGLKKSIYLSIDMPTVVQGFASSVTNSPGVNRYAPVASNGAGWTATEINEDVLMKQSGVFSFFQIRIPANTLSTSTATITFRVNFSATPVVFSFLAGVTGISTVTTVSVQTVIGDYVGIHLSTTAGGTGSINVGCFISNFSTKDRIHSEVLCVNNDVSVTTASTTWYFTPVGEFPTTLLTTESSTLLRMFANCELSNVHIRVTANSRLNTTTLRTRKNSSDGNISVNIAAGTTGLFVDDTNKDSFIVGDDFTYSFTTGTGTANITIFQIDAILANKSDSRIGTFLATGTRTRTASTSFTGYVPFGSMAIAGSTTLSTRQLFCYFRGKLSKLNTLISANTYTGDATLNFRINGTAAGNNGTQLVTILAGVTGLFSDNTNEDVISFGDTLVVGIIGGTANSITIRNISYLLTVPFDSRRASGGLAIMGF